jgi:hypothetical protein
LIWVGLRAYSAAYATGGNPAIDIVDQAGGNPLTVNILSTGYLDIASINAWVTAHSVTAIRATQLYDQTGTGQHFLQFDINSMPQLVINPTGFSANRASLFFSSARADIMNSAGSGITSTQPFTISTVAKRTVTQPSVRGGICGFEGYGAVRFGYSSGASTLYQYAGGALNDFGSVSDNTWYGLQALFAGAASVVNVNGSNQGPNDPGANAPTGSSVFIGTTSSGDNMDGYIAELGVWSGAVGAIGANQKSAWGF